MAVPEVRTVLRAGCGRVPRMQQARTTVHAGVAPMIGKLLGGLWKWAAAAGAVAAGALYLLLKAARAQQAAEKAKRVRAEVKAAGEKAARKHIQDTQETTREVEDDIRKSGADSRRDSLRDYASGAGSGDPE